MPFFTDWGGLSFTQIMLLQSWFVFWIFILEIPTGTIADYLGRKHSLILGAGVNIIAVCLYASIPNFYIFLIAEFTWALAEALVSGAGEAFIYDTLSETGESESSKKVYGRYNTFMLLGFMIAGPIGSVIAAYLGLRAVMFLMVIPFTGGIIIGLTFREPRPDPKAERKSFLKILKEGLRYFVKSKVLLILAFDMISIGTIAFLIIWLYQPMLTEIGIPIAFFGIVQAVWIGCEIVILNNFERLERIFGKKRRYTFFSAFITGVMFIIGGLGLFAANVSLVLIAIIFSAAFGLSRSPLLINYINKHIPSPERATILSTVNMFQMLSWAIIFPFTGLLEEWSLAYTLVIFGICAVLFTFISRVKEEHWID